VADTDVMSEEGDLGFNTAVHTVQQ
jgi:hypothetical protein